MFVQAAVQQPQAAWGAQQYSWNGQTQYAQQQQSYASQYTHAYGQQPAHQGYAYSQPQASYPHQPAAPVSYQQAAAAPQPSVNTAGAGNLDATNGTTLQPASEVDDKVAVGRQVSICDVAVLRVSDRWSRLTHGYCWTQRRKA